MESLRSAFKSNQHSQVIAQLPQLKLQNLSASEFLELFTAASFSFLAVNDLTQFEKHATLVRSLLGEVQTDAAVLVVGLLLIHLLASDRIGDFHVALHLLPQTVRSHRLVQYPVDLERSVMEGNYAKVLSAGRPVEFNPYVAALNEAIAAKAREVMALASQQKTAQLPNPRGEAIASIKVLLAYAQDLQRIV